MYDLSSIQTDLKICFVAMINQHQLAHQGMAIPVRANWPEPHLRKTISQATFDNFDPWFKNTFPAFPEVSPFCPATAYSYEVASSGTTAGVQDFKISPIQPSGASGPAVFNYHVSVV